MQDSIDNFETSCSSSSDEICSFSSETQEQEISLHKNNVYNPRNILVTEQDLQHIFELLGIKDMIVFDISNYRRAFVHKSYSIHNNTTTFAQLNSEINPLSGIIPLQPLSNERDEFFGDGFLDCIIAKYLYEAYDDQDEGFLTRTRTKLVNGNILSHLTYKLGLQRYVLMSKHVEDNCMGRSLTSILGDLLEAFISAIYQDQYIYAEFLISEQLKKQTELMNMLEEMEKNGQSVSGMKSYVQNSSQFMSTIISASGFAFNKTELFVVKLIEKFIDFDELILNETNYKDILLKYFQKKYKGTPIYKEVSVEGPPHKRTFKISVHHIIDDEFLGMGEGKTKRDAQQEAAKHALEKMGLEAKY